MLKYCLHFFPADYEMMFVIKFSNVKKETLIEIYRQLCLLYGPDMMGKKSIRRWCRGLSGHRQNVCDGRPSFNDDDPVE